MFVVCIHATLLIVNILLLLNVCGVHTCNIRFCVCWLDPWIWGRFQIDWVCSIHLSSLWQRNRFLWLMIFDLLFNIDRESLLIVMVSLFWNRDCFLLCACWSLFSFCVRCDELTMEDKLSIVQEQRAKNAELKAKSRALKLKKLSLILI